MATRECRAINLPHVYRRIDTALAELRCCDYDLVREELESIQRDTEHVRVNLRVALEKLLAAGMADALLDDGKVSRRLVGEAVDTIAAVAMCERCDDPPYDGYDGYVASQGAIVDGTPVEGEGDLL